MSAIGANAEILASPEGYHEHKIVDYAPQKSVDEAA